MRSRRLTGRGPAAGGHGDRVPDSEHEGVAAAVSKAQRGPDPAGLRPVAVVLLVAGDKSGQWTRWYRAAIPQAEQLYAGYLAEREKEMGT